MKLAMMMIGATTIEAKMMNGKTGEPQQGSFQSLFNQQGEFQHKVTGLTTPVDNVQWFQYHITAMNEELGEVLKADKRWKTHRNAFHDPDNKLEELADVFVTAINLALFSGIDAETMYEAIRAKISENTKKLEEARKEARKNDSNS